MPAPQPVAPPPEAPTTIVLGDDASPVAANVEAEWDGKLMRGAQDAPHILKRAVEAAGGPQALEAHRRFTAHISIESPLLLRGKLLFDDAKGVLLQLEGVPSQLLWTPADGCQVLYGPRRVPLACTRHQTELANGLWMGTHGLIGRWNTYGEAKSGNSFRYGNVVVNEVGFGGPSGGGAVDTRLLFSSSSGELLQSAFPMPTGGATIRFRRVVSFDNGWRAPSEWRFMAPFDQKSPPPSTGEPPPQEGEGLVPQATSVADLVIMVRRVELGVDPSALVAPRPDAVVGGMGQVRVEAERSSSGALFALPGVSPDSIDEDPNTEWMAAQFYWYFAFTENVGVVDETGTVRIALWLPTTESLPKPLEPHRLPFLAHTCWVTARAEIGEPKELPNFAAQLRKGAAALEKPVQGSAYFRAAEFHQAGDKFGFVGELQIACPASGTP